MAADTTEFSALVPTAEYEKFKARFPQYGATKWFINQALITFNTEMEKNPTAVEQVEASIQQMLDMNRALSSGS